METELKLLIEPNDVGAIRQHPLIQAYAIGPSHEEMLSGVYFDTPRHDLRRADAGLRVRQVNNEWVQTLKVGGDAIGGLHERQEWESKVEGPVPDLAALRKRIDPKSNYAKLIKNLSKPNRLQPTFSTKVKRTVWELRLPEGAEVECVIDEGSIDYGASNAPICELELELKSGEPKQLFDFALQLQGDFAMHIGNLSKADRGYGLAAPNESVAVKATALRLAPKMTVEAAFQAIVNNCLSQIQANELGVTKAHDSESVHQMRVGLRRLRSTLGMFKEVISCPDEIQAELRWLGTELGAARDWDVLTGSTLPQVGKQIADPALLNVVGKATQERATAIHETASAAVMSTRYTTLILMFCGWIQDAGWRTSSSSAQHRQLGKPVRRFADGILARDQKRLMRRGRGLKSADPETRHQVRIAAKKTRYATEFFQSLYPARRTRPYIKALSRLQDELGRLNDAAVAADLLKALETARPEIAASTAFLRGYLVCTTMSDDVRLDRLWKQFKPIPSPCQNQASPARAFAWLPAQSQ